VEHEPVDVRTVSGAVARRDRDAPADVIDRGQDQIDEVARRRRAIAHLGQDRLDAMGQLGQDGQLEEAGDALDRVEGPKRGGDRGRGHLAIERQARALGLVEEAAGLDREVEEHVGGVGRDRPAAAARGRVDGRGRGRGQGQGRLGRRRQGEWRRRGRARRAREAAGPKLRADQGAAPAIDLDAGLREDHQLAEELGDLGGLPGPGGHQRVHQRAHFSGARDLESLLELGQRLVKIRWHDEPVGGACAGARGDGRGAPGEGAAVRPRS
jgi:hypothetical protein